MKRSLKLAVTLLSLIFMILPVYGLTPVEVDRICSLTIEGYPGEGGHFYLYKVADADESLKFSLTDEFRPYEENVIVNDIHDQQTWASLAETLPSYVYGDSIPFKYDGYITNGTCQFEVETGLYLILSDPVEYDGWIYRTIPMLISVPTGDDYIPNVDEWIYDYSIVPKQEREKPEPGEKEYKVVKQWDDGNGEKRPLSITVNLIRNGSVAEQVVLNKDNDWCHTWKAEDDGAVWNVQEVSIPEGYKVTNTVNGTVYTIKNTGDVPNTSDQRNLKSPMIALCVSGTVALLAGYLLLTGRKEETE